MSEETTPRRAGLERQLALEWRRVGSELVLLTQAVSDRLGVNATDMQCLGILTAVGAMTAGELAERTALTTGAVTGVIDRLERAGLATREKDLEDRRRVIVQPLSDAQFQQRAPELDAVFGALAVGDAAAASASTDNQLELVIDFLRRSHPVVQNQIAATRQGTAAPGDTSAPLGATAVGHLIFARGLNQVSVDAAADPDQLYSARFEGTVPEIKVRDGTVVVIYRRFGLFEGRTRPSHFSLNPTIPWAVEVRGGLSHCQLGLGELQLRSFEVRGGINELELELGVPTGTVPLRVIGGISKLTVRRPAGTALTLQVRGGLSKLALDGQEFGAIGGQLRLESRGMHDGADHYVLEITGGASRLDIGTR